MRFILILGLLAAVGWAGWDYYEDGHFDMPATIAGLGEYGMSLGVGLDIGGSIRGLAARVGGSM